MSEPTGIGDRMLCSTLPLGCVSRLEDLAGQVPAKHDTAELFRGR